MAEALTTYTGNAGLGAGSNADIAVISPNSNLDTLNQTANQIRNQDYETNLRLFNQKVNDRDTLRELLAKGITASGEIDEQDRPIYDAAEKKTIDSFHNIKSLNDQKSIEDFYKNATDLNNVVTHAQERNLSLKQLQAEKAKETLPFKQQAYSDFIASQRKKPFGERIDPYQQTFSFNTDPILKLYTTATKSYDSQDGLFHFDDTVGDYAQTLKNAQGNYLENGETAEDMRQLYSKFQNYNPTEQGKALQALDAQIDKYNSDTGSNVSHIQRQELKDADGNVVGYAIQEQIPDFAAKFALANQPEFLNQKKTFNDKYGKYETDLAKADIDKQKLFLDAKKVGLEGAKANAYVKHMGALDKKLSEASNTTNTDISKMYGDFVNNLSIQNKVMKMGKKTEDVGGAVYVDNLPNSYQSIGGVIAGQNQKGQPTITIGAITPFEKAGRKYYVPKYVDATTGNEIKINSNNQFDDNTWNDNYKASREQGFKGSVQDYLKIIMKKGGIELALKGTNGTATLNSMYQSQKAINDKLTTKGEENIINPPESSDYLAAPTTP